MRLSEAIRLGAMLKPQGFGNYTDQFGGTCAIGAACEAAGIDAHSSPDVARYEIAYVRPIDGACPECGVARFTGIGGNLIVHLNDTHRWTRERIADHVATIEAQHEAKQAEPLQSVSA